MSADGFSCGWDLVHACDYRCPYCFFIPSWTTHPEETNSRHRACSKEDWLSFWERCFAQLGSFRIEIAGGEPFQHPDALAIFAGVQIRHRLHVVTNLSADAREIAAALDPRRVSFSASFHPSHACINEFLEKLRILKSAGFSATASLVAYPAHFAGLEGWLAAIRGEGVACYLNPFQGAQAGRAYPQAYTAKQADFVRRNTFPQSLDIRLREASPRGRACAAGFRYFRLWPDGTIHRCCAATELKLGPLGTIRDPVVPVLDGPSPCPADKCFAPNELAMLVEP